MKKTLAMILAAMLILSLAACAAPASVPDQNEAHAPAETTDVPAKDTDAPAIETEAPAEPTEEPTEEPSDPLVEAAWPIAERIAALHEVTVTDDGTASYDGDYGTVIFTDGTDDPITIIRIDYVHDGTEWTERSANLDLEMDEKPDMTKWDADLAAVAWNDFETTPEKLKDLGVMISGSGEDPSYVAMYASSLISDNFMFCDDDNYFKCTLSFAGSLKQPEDGLFDLRLVVDPVNERYFAAAYGDFMGPLNKSERYPETDYLFTLLIMIRVEKTDEGGFRVSYEPVV